MTINFGGAVNRDDLAYGVALYPDGRIVAVGGAFITVGTSAFEFLALARLNTNGTLDSSFGTSGRVTGLQDTVGLSVAIDGAGKIVAGGAEPAFSSGSAFGLGRFNENGTPDNSFGGDGWVTTSFGGAGSASITSLKLTQDGDIVAGGGAGNSTFDFALAKYNPDGSLDSNFGAGGKVLTDFEGDYDAIRSITLDDAGGIVASGECVCAQSGGSAFALARYGGDGTLDTTFGEGGKVEATPGSGSDDQAKAVALQSDGKIVLGGQALSDSCSSACPKSDFTLARYNLTALLIRALAPKV